MALSASSLIDIPTTQPSIWNSGDFGDDAFHAPAAATATGTRFSWPSVIAIEGLIGAGKSTLCDKLGTANPLLWEPLKEQANPLFLKLFYADQPKYGWAMQWGMLMSRLYQMRLAERRRVVAEVQDQLARLSEQPGNGGTMVSHRHSRRPPTLLWDRSMLGDGIFALANYLRGNISHDELAVYESEYGSAITTPHNAPWAKAVDFFVFLEDDPSACKRRVEDVRGNASEAGIPDDYYRTLDDLHFNAMLGLASHGAPHKVIVLPWATYDSADEFESRIRAKIDALDATRPDYRGGGIVYTTMSPSAYIVHANVPEAASPFVYECAEDIKGVYVALAQARAKSALMDKDDDLIHVARMLMAYRAGVVFLPDDASVRLTAEETGFRRDSKYDIPAYINAFKRIVSWHLSQDTTVVLYRRTEPLALSSA